MSECLIASGGAHSKASIFYGADEYLEACPSPLIILEVSLLRHIHPRGQELQKKYAHDSEIATMKDILPDEGDPNAPAMVWPLRGASCCWTEDGSTLLLCCFCCLHLRLA